MGFSYIKTKAADNTGEILAQMNFENNSEAEDMKNESNILTTDIKIPNLEKQLDKEIEEEKREQNRLALQNEIINYLGDNIDNVGLSYIDINTTAKIDINNDKVFVAASTVKVGMNMVLADLYKSGQVSPDESLTYTDDCYEEGTGILQGTDLSEPISIRKLTEYSIVYSDNIATNMIIKRIGYENMRNLIDAKVGHPTDHSDNYLTAGEESTLLKQLYDNASKNSDYAKIIELMKNTVFHDRIDSSISHEIVAHKIGNVDANAHDVGIVYTKNPYILAIYTNNLSDPNKVISDISQMIYKYQSQM